MTLNERLQEAFDKRVFGTAMTSASDLLSAMTAIEHAEAENAALKEQVAQWETEYNGCSALLNNAERTIETLEETITQQAEAIRLKDVLLSEIAKQIPEKPDYWSSCGQCERNAGDAEDALALQPSPEILQARDERVAEACKAACENERLGEIIGDSDQAYENAITHCSQAIDSKEWRKYL